MYETNLMNHKHLKVVYAPFVEENKGELETNWPHQFFNENVEMLLPQYEKTLQYQYEEDQNVSVEEDGVGVEAHNEEQRGRES